jgi:hypothetical protein
MAAEGPAMPIVPLILVMPRRNSSRILPVPPIVLNTLARVSAFPRDSGLNPASNRATCSVGAS